MSTLIDQEQWKTLSHVLTPEYVKSLHDRATECLHQLHQDYLPNISMEQFFRDYMGHTSLYAKLLAYRFFTTEIFQVLRSKVQTAIATHYGPGEVLLHPIFYLRFSYPGEMYPVKYRASFLGSQPHYDRSYSLYAFSFWTALADVDQETGGLCFFNKKEVTDLFEPTDRNRYNLDLYTENSSRLDPLIREACVQPSLPAGSMLMFDSNVLHGGTKPITKPRISMDFRMVWGHEVEKKDQKTRDTVKIFNASPTYCNAMNLLALKDFVGAARQMKVAAEELRSDYLRHLSNVLASLPIETALQQPFVQMRWQEEYKWV